MRRKKCAVCNTTASSRYLPLRNYNMKGIRVDYPQNEFLCAAHAKMAYIGTLAVDYPVADLSSSASSPSTTAAFTAVPASPPLPEYAVEEPLPVLPKRPDIGCCCCAIARGVRFYWRQNQWFKDLLRLEQLARPISPYICEDCKTTAHNDVSALVIHCHQELPPVSEASADSVMTSKRPRTQSLSASPIVLPSAKPLVPYDQLTNPARTSKMLADHIGFLFKQYGQTSTGIELLQQDVYERLAPVFQIASKDEALLQVGRNAAKMVADLPHNSPFRLPLLALLIPNMTNQQIHSTLCASVCTIHRSSAHLPQGKNIIRDTLQEKGISRQRKTEEKGDADKFWTEQCKPSPNRTIKRCCLSRRIST